MFYTLRAGTLHVRVGTQNRQIAAPTDLNPRSQSGLLGIAVDPEFATNRFIYTYQSSNRGGSMDNRIRRWRVNGDYTQASEDRDILTGIPWGSDGGHSGGRLRFGPDGFLYVTTGDTRSATVPQDLRGLGSKVLRITREGEPAPGNPDLGSGTRREIFAYGFRNPQGLAFRPGTSQLFICEHGPNNDDEVTWVRAGGNGGWDPNDGNGNYSGYSGALMTDLRKFPMALRPTWVLNDSAGMAGCDFLRGSQWQSWDGRLAVGVMAALNLRFLELDYEGTGMIGTPPTAFAGVARLRGITQGPDGFLYVATDDPAPNGQIWRVRPQ